LKTSLKLLLFRARKKWDQENMSRRTGKVVLSKLAKLSRYLQEANQLTERNWEVLQHLEHILTTFETVVKTFEGDGQVWIHQNSWQGSYRNVWNVILAYKLLLGQLKELKQPAATLPDSK
jgi:hypothetical protein